MKNNKKKKILVIALLLFAIIGVAGYGVYSYYWTEGEVRPVRYIDDYDDVIHLNGSFNPHIDGSSYILGWGGGIDLTCGEPDANYNITCSGEIEIVNDGSTAVDVEVLNPSYYGQSYVSSDYTPTFNWTSTRIAAGERATLRATATSTVEIGVDDSNPQEVNSPVVVYPQLGVSFELKATQVH